MFTIAHLSREGNKMLRGFLSPFMQDTQLNLPTLISLLKCKTHKEDWHTCSSCHLPCLLCAGRCTLAYLKAMLLYLHGHLREWGWRYNKLSREEASPKSPWRLSRPGLDRYHVSWYGICIKSEYLPFMKYDESVSKHNWCLFFLDTFFI